MNELISVLAFIIAAAIGVPIGILVSEWFYKKFGQCAEAEAGSHTE